MNRKEPLIRLAKRDDLGTLTAWIIRIASIFAALILFAGLIVSVGYNPVSVYVAMICYTILEGVLRPEFMPAQTVLAFCAGYTLIAVLGRFFRWNSERNRKYRQLLRVQRFQK